MLEDCGKKHNSYDRFHFYAAQFAGVEAAAAAAAEKVSICQVVFVELYWLS